MNRYHRQMLLPGIGEAGQARLRDTRVLLVGCGALGTVLADTLVRAGVGGIDIVDRDVVEITNLQRQILFDERDAAEGRPKAVAAAERLRRINSDVDVRAFIEDFNHTNASRFIRDADLILDGLDNFETRYLLNDLAVAHGRPYIYGGAVGTTGMACAFLPRGTKRRSGVRPGRVAWPDDFATPCLRCIFPEPPPAGSTPTCDTAGVLAPAVGIIAHHQAAQAIKLLAGDPAAVDRSLLSIDVWRNEFRRLDVSAALSDDCATCARGEFDFLDGRHARGTTTLCGRNAVQILPAAGTSAAGGAGVDLAALAERLRTHGEFRINQHMLRGRLEGAGRGDHGEPAVEITVFADGRVLVSGIDRPEVARMIYDRYIGG